MRPAGRAWRLAVAALPEEGKPCMEKWVEEPDNDIGWIMKEDMKKNRLARVGAVWVREWSSRLERG